MQQKACVIAVDVGTQSTKGLLVTETGEVAATAAKPHRVDFPRPGWAQQEVQEWIGAVREVIRALCAAAPGPVLRLAISAQVDGVVPVDDRLRPLHPAIIWMDRRAAREAQAVQESLGATEIYAVTGLNCDASHAAPKMRWLLDRVEGPVRYLMPPASMVAAWLTGNVAQDHANASCSMLYDVRARRLCAPLLEAFGIDAALVPPIVDSTEDLGPLRPEARADLGLSGECRVIAGTGDDHAGAVGAGACSPGIVVDVTGTAEPIGTSAAVPVFDPQRLVEAHAHAVPGMAFIENPGFVSGGSTLWASRMLGIGQDEVLDRAAAAVPGAKGLTFLPALSGSMTPRWNAHARGAFTGLSMDHGPQELCRAVLEGCAFAARDVVDRLSGLGLPVEEIRVTGGGGRSRTWMQIKADVLGRPVRAVAGQSCAMGAACLAAAAAGWHSSVQEAAAALVRPETHWYQPDPNHSGAYEAAYRRYRQMFDALEPTFRPS